MEDEEHEELVSKSSRKREAQDIKNMGLRLTELSDDQLSALPYDNVKEAVVAYRKIGKGGARKRQLMYIGKLLRKVDLEPVSVLIDRYDASSLVHVQQFHQLESWRERLIGGDDSVFEEIGQQHPEFDRQQLRQLVKSAKSEVQRQATNPDLPPRQYRKLFQFLKSLDPVT